jgi:hypothetical protein
MTYATATDKTKLYVKAEIKLGLSEAPTPLVPSHELALDQTFASRGCDRSREPSSTMRTESDRDRAAGV